MKTEAEIIEEIDRLIALWRVEIKERRTRHRDLKYVPYELARIVCQLECLKDWLDEQPENIIPLPQPEPLPIEIDSAMKLLQIQKQKAGD